MGAISLVRSLVSKEGDHERGTYLLKTGYRPDPTLVHSVDRRDLLPSTSGRPGRNSAACFDFARPVAGQAAPGQSVRRVQDARPGASAFPLTGQARSNDKPSAAPTWRVVDSAFLPAASSPLPEPCTAARSTGLGDDGIRRNYGRSKPATSRPPCAPHMATPRLGVAAWPRAG